MKTVNYIKKKKNEHSSVLKIIYVHRERGSENLNQILPVKLTHVLWCVYVTHKFQQNLLLLSNLKCIHQKKQTQKTEPYNSSSFYIFLPTEHNPAIKLLELNE